MTHTKSWPNKALVGYITADGSTAPPHSINTIVSSAINHNYKVFVYAFGCIDSNYEVTLPSGFNETDLEKQIAMINKDNGLALISFGGGGNNTFLPGDDPISAASATVTFCQKYQFNGIDLDLEHAPFTSNYLISYIEEIRKQDETLFITAAPQIASNADGSAALAPREIFTPELISTKLTAILVQEYNQGEGAIFDGLDDTNPDFIVKSFAPLKRIIPSETKIIIGKPACKDAAGSGFNSPASIVRSLQKECSGVIDDPQYGGIMTWDINYDSAQNWSFADGVQTVT